MVDKTVSKYFRKHQCSAVTAVLTQTCTLQYQYGMQCYKFHWAVRLQLGVSDSAKLK